MAHLLPLLLLFAAVLLLPHPSSCTSLPLRVNLTHMDSRFSNLSIDDRNLLAVKRSRIRTAYISSRLSTSSADVQTDVQTDVHYFNSEYMADLAIGTPPVPVTALFDTGSDLIWTKCESGSSYDPTASSSYSTLSCGSTFCQIATTSCFDGSTCSFSTTYGGGTMVEGIMATETFSFGGTDVLGLAFGCSNTETGPAPFSGILGMGGGQLSLVSQLGSGKFSYCLTTYGQSLNSPLLFGSLAAPDPSSQSTTIIESPNIPTFYYLSLQGITVGSTLLSIPSSAFAISSDGSGGVIIDSGTVFTMLVPEAYDVLKQEFQSQIGLPVATGGTFDLCFSSPAQESFQPPNLIFHFEGADIDLPATNYFISHGGGSLLCLAILPSNAGFSIFGSFQQQNMHIAFDVQSQTIYFAPAQCEKL